MAEAEARQHSAKLWLGGAGLALAALAAFQLHPILTGSGNLMGEVHVDDGKAFMTECMEASLMWKANSVDFRLAATSQERAALRSKCTAAYATSEITPEMREVRSGARIVREGQEGVITTGAF